MKKILLFAMMVMSVTFIFAQKKKSNTKVSKVITSDIRWWGYKLVKTDATTHSGYVKLKSGKFNFEKGELVDGEFVIDMRSLSATDLTGEDQVTLTNDLKSINFFEVKKFPVAKFHMTKIIPLKDEVYNYTVIGNLTVKGKRKTISFPARIKVDNYSVSMESAKFSINRQDYGVFYRSSLRDVIIKDDMDIQIKVATK
jgi:polyisoprenoid-binding protein YceI